MGERDHKNLLEKSHRRAFVTRVLGGAAIAPLIAAVSASKAQACPLADPVEYLGPNLFTVFLSDPTGQTRAHGVATFEILSPDNLLEDTSVTYTLKLTANAVAAQGFLILAGGTVVVNLPLGTPASIQAIDYDPATFADALEAAAAGVLTMKLIVQVNGHTYDLFGKFVAAPNSQTIEIISGCIVVTG